MNQITRALSLMLLGCSAVNAQSFNFDFGPRVSRYGTPRDNYAGMGRAGRWTPIVQAAQYRLRDVNGDETGAWIQMSGDPQFGECNVPGPMAGDAALLNDRVFYPGTGPGFQTLRFAGMEPGRYKVRIYGLNGCEAPWDFQLQISGHPGSVLVLPSLGGTWNTGLEEGANYLALDYFSLAPGWSVYLSLRSSSSAQDRKLSGIQFEKVREWESFCGGDGSSGPCPCNNDSNQGTGCTNSTGVGAHLVPSGTANLAAADLAFSALNLPPGCVASLLAGRNSVSQGVLAGDGLLCVGGSLARLGMRLSSAAGTAEWNSPVQDLGALYGYSGLSFQVWYRDAAGSTCTSNSNLSQAVRVWFLL